MQSRSLALIALGVVLLATSARADDASTLTGSYGSKGVGGGPLTLAPGTSIDSFPVGNAVGVAFDAFDADGAYVFLEGTTPGIVHYDRNPPYAATPLTYSKLGGQDVDGGAVDRTTGNIYASDYQGDLSAIDDNVYLFDPAGNTIAFWETDVGLAGTPCSGGNINQIVDVAIDPSVPGRLYATSSGDNLIHILDLSDTSGGNAAPSPCAVLGTVAAPPPLVNVVGIDYDACNDGYWLSDFGSTTIVLVANDGTFATVLASFTFDSGAGFNTGVTAASYGVDPLETWVVDFNLQSLTRLDSGTTGCVCGDGDVQPLEICDDGNVANGDCCSSACTYEASGSPCSDADPCTRDTCDGSGTCGQLPTGCKAAGKSLLLLKNDATDGKDKLVWKWKNGAATTLAELGVPTGTTNYTLCLRSGLASASVALPGGAKWQASGSTGFKYGDSTGAPNGAQKALLKSGAGGKAKAQVKGKGVNLPDTLVPALTLPVTVQLVNDSNNTCFEATYGVALKNDVKQFKGKTP